MCYSLKSRALFVILQTFTFNVHLHSAVTPSRFPLCAQKLQIESKSADSPNKHLAIYASAGQHRSPAAKKTEIDL